MVFRRCTQRWISGRHCAQTPDFVLNINHNSLSISLLKFFIKFGVSFYSGKKQHFVSTLSKIIISHWHFWKCLWSKSVSVPFVSIQTEGEYLPTASEGNFSRGICQLFCSQGEGYGSPPPPRQTPLVLTSSGGHCSGQYASYWNTFLLLQYLVGWWQRTFSDHPDSKMDGAKDLSPPSNNFGWSQRNFHNNPNTETDADHKPFFTHFI